MKGIFGAEAPPRGPAWRDSLGRWWISGDPWQLPGDYDAVSGGWTRSMVWSPGSRSWSPARRPGEDAAGWRQAIWWSGRDLASGPAWSELALELAAQLRAQSGSPWAYVEIWRRDPMVAAGRWIVSRAIHGDPS
jgi:hypothetical protein